MESSISEDERAGHIRSPDDVTSSVLASVTAHGPVRRVAISALSPGESPRLEGERIDHVRVLANAQTELPPIIVHRPSMRVIDGMHRLRAAQMCGERTVECVFFDGGDDLAFVAAVVANGAHGLPLSLADREAAAARILAGHSAWSNRTVAAITSLAPSTVAAIRRREEGDGPPAETTRLGRDGRVRPLSTAEGRRVASEIIAKRPEASLREVARAAGISTGTVRDVRRRLARGEDPVPVRRVPGAGQTHADGAQHARRLAEVSLAAVPDRSSLLRKLRNDPSLRLTENGRRLLRWLDTRTVGPDGWESVFDAIPPHSAYVVAELAYLCAERWFEAADALRARSAPRET